MIATFIAGRRFRARHDFGSQSIIRLNRSVGHGQLSSFDLNERVPPFVRKRIRSIEGHVSIRSHPNNGPDPFDYAGSPTLFEGGSDIK